jgi:hypothetical protein
MKKGETMTESKIIEDLKREVVAAEEEARRGFEHYKVSMDAVYELREKLLQAEWVKGKEKTTEGLPSQRGA